MTLPVPKNSFNRRGKLLKVVQPNKEQVESTRELTSKEVIDQGRVVDNESIIRTAGAEEISDNALLNSRDNEEDKESSEEAISATM